MKASEIVVAGQLIAKRDGLLNDLYLLNEPTTDVYVQLVHRETGDELGSMGGVDEPDLVTAIRTSLAERIEGQLQDTEAELTALGITDLPAAGDGDDALCNQNRSAEVAP
ncbi:MAG: hypothetical protein WBP38_00240 [Hyphomicrobium sp.]